MAASDIFDAKSRWTAYQAEHQLRTLVGGIPKDPDTIRKWLKARLELNDTRSDGLLAEETIAEDGLDTNRIVLNRPRPACRHRHGQRHQRQQLQDGRRSGSSLEGRNIKAAIKEAANALYPGVKPWPGHPGKEIRKGLTSWLDRKSRGRRPVHSARPRPARHRRRTADKAHQRAARETVDDQRRRRVRRRETVVHRPRSR